MKKILYILIGVAAAACGTSKVASNTPTAPAAPANTQATAVAHGAVKFPGYTTEMFTSGKALYEGNCGKCHGLFAPGDYTEEKWEKIVPWMVNKTNKSAGSEVINGDQKELIRKYLITLATEPKG